MEELVAVSRATHRWILRLLPLLGVILVWSLLTWTIFTENRLFPTPLDVLENIIRILSGDSPIGSTYVHAIVTLFRFVTAFIIALIGGTLLGIIAGRVKVVFDIMDQYIWIAMSVPSVVWVFIFVILIGISNVVPISALVVILGAPVFITIAEGTKSIPVELLTMAKSYHATPAQMWYNIYLPFLVPYMISSARVISALGIKIVIIAEVIGLSAGIGFVLKYWFDQVFTAPIVAWGLILTVFGVTIDRLIFKRLEKKATAWSRAGKVASTVARVV